MKMDRGLIIRVKKERDFQKRIISKDLRCVTQIGEVAVYRRLTFKSWSVSLFYDAVTVKTREAGMIGIKIAISAIATWGIVNDFACQLVVTWRSLPRLLQYPSLKWLKLTRWQCFPLSTVALPMRCCFWCSEQYPIEKMPALILKWVES